MTALDGADEGLESGLKIDCMPMLLHSLSRIRLPDLVWRVCLCERHLRSSYARPLVSYAPSETIPVLATIQPVLAPPSPSVLSRSPLQL